MENEKMGVVLQPVLEGLVKYTANSKESINSIIAKIPRIHNITDNAVKKVREAKLKKEINVSMFSPKTLHEYGIGEENDGMEIGDY